MKKLIAFLIVGIFMIPMLFAQTGEEIVIDKFTGIFMAVAGVVFLGLTWLATKITWIAKIANLKLVSAIISAVIAIVGVFVTGLPPLTIGTAFSVITFLYNFVRGYIDTKNGQTISAKETEAKSLKIGSK